MVAHGGAGRSVETPCAQGGGRLHVWRAGQLEVGRAHVHEIR